MTPRENQLRKILFGKSEIAIPEQPMFTVPPPISVDGPAIEVPVDAFTFSTKPVFSTLQDMKEALAKAGL